jgi:flagellar export protein FliJ
MMAKKPEYRLQTLLEMRQRKKDEAEKILGEALAAHKLELERQKQLELELARMEARREQKRREYAEKSMRGEMAAQDVIGANTFIKRLLEQEEMQKSAIEAQKAVVEYKKKALDAARQAVVTATQELKALEKHKEKLLEEWKKEQQTKEEETMDELAQQIFLKGDHF